MLIEGPQDIAAAHDPAVDRIGHSSCPRSSSGQEYKVKVVHSSLDLFTWICLIDSFLFYLITFIS